MAKESDAARRDRKAREGRDRRRKRGLQKRGDGGGSGKGQGRKMEYRPDRPTCCDRPMLSDGMGDGGNWLCKVCGASPRKKTKEKDDD